jgi:prolyl-tRNA editing enzyme YbaK/EbsC (Cys-tRNA(Pro) deacylase)
MEPLTSAHVQQVLDRFDLGLHVVSYDVSTATSELAAAAIGCEVAQIAKSICLLVDGAPLLVVASGINQVDDRRIAALRGVGRKKVRMARAEECVEIFGYVPGGVPPVGHRTADILIYLDQDLQRYDRIYAAAGSATINFGLTPEQLALITGGTWQEIARGAADQSAQA